VYLHLVYTQEAFVHIQLIKGYMMTTIIKKMKAIGFTESLPISDPQSLFVFDTDYPEVGPHDVIVKVSAVSINPANGLC
jgi:NADPH:quinone reductase-like Zn-dependent oxidoreductase